jgi:hypothetical protein
MKKSLLTIVIFAGALSFAKAQVLPSFAMGIKGGENFLTLSNSPSTFNTSNQSGYFGGLWSRFGALGINFQSEVLYDKRNVDYSGGITGSQAVTSIDVPLLLGGKIGTRSFGVRFYAGGIASFVIDQGNSLSQTAESSLSSRSLEYQTENYYLTGGIGVDLGRLSVDARYEKGLTDITYNLTQKTKPNLFNISIAFTMFRL